MESSGRGVAMSAHNPVTRAGGPVERVPDSGVRRLRAMLMDSCQAEPLRHLDDAISKLSSSAVKVKKSKGAVNEFVSKSQRRRDDGAIDSVCLHAELVGAAVVARLSEALLDIAKTARESKDVYAIHLVHIACDTLISSSATGGLLQPELYAVDTPGLKSRIVRSKLARAEGLYNAVVQSIGDAPSRLDKTIPAFADIAATVPV